MNNNHYSPRQRWLAGIVAAVVIALMCIPYAYGQTVVKADKQWSSEGQYLAYASPWCAMNFDKTLVEGRDYANTITYQKGQLASGSNVQLTWRWPEASKRSKKCGVLAYNHVAQGDYEGGATMKPVAPRQIKSLSDMTITYGVDYASDPSTFNGLIEFYATRVAGKADDKAMEIGWFWNAPAETQAWAKTGKQLGVCTDRYGKRWTIARNDNYVTFTPASGAQAWGIIDVTGSLSCLKGTISGDWWINGAAIGVEPLGGFGTAIVRSFKVAQR